MNGYNKFLEKYARARNISPKEAETHAQAQATREYYKNKENKEVSINAEYEAINAQLELHSSTMQEL